MTDKSTKKAKIETGQLGEKPMTADVKSMMPDLEIVQPRRGLRLMSLSSHRP